MKKLTLAIVCYCFALLPAFAAEIQVTAPAAGTSWKIGTTQTVQWTFSGLPASTKVHVLLWHEGTNLGKIAKQHPVGTNGAGSFSWSVGAIEDAPAASVGSGYTIKVRTVDDTAAGNSGSFSLTSGSTMSGPQASQLEHNYDLVPKKTKPAMPGVSGAQLKMLQVTAPQAGAVLDPTAFSDISWKFVNIPASNVSITLLRDGQQIAVLAANIPDPGEFHWDLKVQNPDPGTYKVAVEKEDKEHRGLSGAFSIKEKGAIQSIFPDLEGMPFYNDMSFDAQWKRTGNIQLLNITLERKDSNWEQTLAAGVAAKLEKQNVSLGSIEGGVYRIRYTHSEDGGFSSSYSPYFNVITN